MKLLRTDILIKLPKYTEQRVREMESGLLLNTLDEKIYYPRHGEVIGIADAVKGVKIGDIVFFSWIAWDKAKETSWGVGGESDKAWENTGNYAIKDDDGHKMICPISEILLIKRGEELIATNKYVLCEPNYKNNETLTIEGGIVETSGVQNGIILVDVSNEKYRANEFSIVLPNDTDMPIGNVCYTLRHCDIAIEEELQDQILGRKLFCVEKANIVAYRDKDGVLQAGEDYVLIKRDEVVSKGAILLPTQEPSFTGVVHNGKFFNQGQRVIFEKKNYMEIDGFTAVYRESVFMA